MLPIFFTQNKDLQLMQTKWASELNPILKNPGLQVLLLKQISLVTGSNTINHKLGRTLQGWYIVDVNAPITIYRSAEKNDLTLTLTSSGNATVDIMVF